MPELIFLIGISGSGKSTFASQMRHIQIVSSDSIREELFGYESIQANPGKVFDIAHKRVRHFLESGMDVIFDATNVSAFARNSLLSFIRDVPCKKTCVFFSTTPEVALERQKMRSRQVPEEAIRRQYDTLLNEANDIPLLFDKLVISA